MSQASPASSGIVIPAKAGTHGRRSFRMRVTNRRARATHLARLTRTTCIALFLIALASPPPAPAQVTNNPTPLQFRDAAEERRFHALTAELRCVKCQNQSLADSNAQVAQDLRAEVLRLMQEGRSDAQIEQHLVQRYGEFVLYRPRVEASTWLLWFGPLLLLAAGAFVVVKIARRRSASPPAADDTQEW
jgi:cytochrome c-type biogenesis protein CcmH